jgi:anti-sigma regulatory factor (Ser/Thr protein kinase)
LGGAPFGRGAETCAKRVSISDEYRTRAVEGLRNRFHRATAARDGQRIRSVSGYGKNVERVDPRGFSGNCGREAPSVKMETKEWGLRGGDFASITELRREFREFIRNLGAGDTMSAEIIFGELVTNAMRYGENPMSVNARVENDAVRLRVNCAGHCFDLNERLATPPSLYGGRGLQIVAKLSDSLTVAANEDCPCCVTATFPLMSPGLGPFTLLPKRH